ncbi:glycerate-2-kinase family protein [Dehalococcoidia bacterium]|nr:glycerate-2-kinase family protein [Dehalococcoidia bacterium]MCL0078400.1 glycerate-2-kinase family protein [Dehalococcoidia bacterium]MCL0090434.1 glycerate-2-kinase family protein [Dehalococcoidia bacterium]
MRDTTQLLLMSGASIREINTVRKHLLEERQHDKSRMFSFQGRGC